MELLSVYSFLGGILYKCVIELMGKGWSPSVNIAIVLFTQTQQTRSSFVLQISSDIPLSMGQTSVPKFI